MSAEDTEAVIERALRDDPGYAEQLLAEGSTVVVLDGELIVRLSPDGSREILRRNGQP